MNFTEDMFPEEELEEIRSLFYFTQRDPEGNKRLFFDNAGGSLRLKRAEDEFHRISSYPDAPGHSNRLAGVLEETAGQGRRDLKEIIFNAAGGALYPGYTASAVMMEMIRVISENAVGTNYVTTVLEHPSSFDAMELYARKTGCELRVAQANRETGGVDAEEVLSLIDKNTAVLSCMAASNISGYKYDIETIFREARRINPELYIICDAVQHAPHGILEPEKYGVDAMNFAPYKFFGVRGFGVAYLSDRAARLEHNRLAGKPADEWLAGSETPAHLAAVTEIVNYVATLGKKQASGCTDRGKLFRIGMERIAAHERGLLQIMLEGTEREKGLRHMERVKVQMDGRDLRTRDLILGIEFEHLDPKQAAAEYEKRGIVTFERTYDSIYSTRMLDAFASKGVVRISPLHVNTPREMEDFLKATSEIAGLK